MSNSIPRSDDADNADSEAASEKPPMRKRGRPRATPQEWDAFAGGMFGDKTRRTQIKRFHASRALALLEHIKGQDFGYVNDHWEILAELGQLDDDERIVEAATDICEHKVKAKDAVQMIRNWRTGKTAPADPDALAKEITRLIGNYQIRHPGMSPRQVRDALVQVLIECDENQDEADQHDDLGATGLGVEEESC
jgi:hypothetical protein